MEKTIFSKKFKNDYRKEDHFFVRNRLFSFPTIIAMKINIISKSLSVEVSKFLSKFHFSRKEKDGSKQAFSKARAKIKWEGFEYLNDMFIKQYYSDQEYKKYKGVYLVLGTDGTTYQLPYEEELVERFNECNNGQAKQSRCLAQGVKIYDVLNKLTLLSSMDAYSATQSKGVSEQGGFENHLCKLPQLVDCEKHNILILGDKYYPGFYYFHELPRLGYSYIFRCKADFCKEVEQFTQQDEVDDQLLSIDLKRGSRKYSSSAARIENMPDTLLVRCVKIRLPNGEMEYLLTNIKEEELDLSEMQELYGCRWGEETSFDTDKNKIEIENFSSKTVNGVLQDFHARTLSCNLTQILVRQAQEELDAEQAQKQNIHHYQINLAVAIGLVKDELPKLLLGYESAEIWYNRMVKKILRRREPIRPGRNFPREKKHNIKYHLNKRRVT